MKSFVIVLALLASITCTVTLSSCEDPKGTVMVSHVGYNAYGDITVTIGGDTKIIHEYYPPMGGPWSCGTHQNAVSFILDPGVYQVTISSSTQTWNIQPITVDHGSYSEINFN